jgi:FeS assembly SUF system regulator
MLRISKLADYSILIMSEMAKVPEGLLSAVQVATATRVSLPTVRKLLKQLQLADLVASHRGANGGYAITKPVKQISVADIIVAIDGPIAMTECTQSMHHCDKAPVCDTKASWRMVNNAIESALRDVSLQAMCEPLEYPSLTLKGIKIESVMG